MCSIFSVAAFVRQEWLFRNETKNHIDRRLSTALSCFSFAQTTHVCAMALLIDLLVKHNENVVNSSSARVVIAFLFACGRSVVADVTNSPAYRQLLMYGCTFFFAVSYDLNC